MYLYIYAYNAPPVRYYAKLACNNVIKYRFVFLKDIKVVEMTELELDFFMAQRWYIPVHIRRTKLKIGRSGTIIYCIHKIVIDPLCHYPCSHKSNSKNEQPQIS